MKRFKVGIAGVSGYTGIELFKRLIDHPRVDVVAMTSEQSAGQHLDQVFPVLLPNNRRGPLLKSIQELDPTNLDTVFLCLPHKGAADWVAAHARNLPQVIDLSADFRLESSDYDGWYGFSHPIPQLVDSAVYGLTELNRAAIQGARLIANPGCYPTCALLGILPLAMQAVIDPQMPIVIDAKSGVSGAGRKATLTNAFAEANENLSPYGLGNSHRHVPELRQALRKIGHFDGEVLFTPHLVPLTRGMLTTTYLKLSQGSDINHARAILGEAYTNSPFVHLLESGTASIAHVAHTNHCAISIHEAGAHLIVVSAIDNLLKGASGQALQNFNVSHDLDEAVGIL